MIKSKVEISAKALESSVRVKKSIQKILVDGSQKIDYKKFLQLWKFQYYRSLIHKKQII